MTVDPNQINLDESQRRRLAELSEHEGRPWNEVLSEALGMYRVAKGREVSEVAGRSFYDVMEEDGVIGIVKDAPEDLSTNPRHMEGFGESDGGNGAC